MQPVGEMSCETRPASVWRTKSLMWSTSTACISGKLLHIALSRRYAARSTARSCSSSARSWRISNGSCSSCSAGRCALRFISSVCMSGLGPLVRRSSSSHTTPLPPSASAGGVGAPSSTSTGLSSVTLRPPGSTPRTT